MLAKSCPQSAPKASGPPHRYADPQAARGALIDASALGREEGRLLDATVARLLAQADERHLRLPPVPGHLIPALQAEAGAQAAPPPDLPEAVPLEAVLSALAEAADALLDLARTVARRDPEIDDEAALALEAEWEERQHEERQFQRGWKRCARCQAWRAFEEYPPDRARADTLSAVCFPCYAATRIRLT